MVFPSCYRRRLGNQFTQMYNMSTLRVETLSLTINLRFKHGRHIILCNEVCLYFPLNETWIRTQEAKFGRNANQLEAASRHASGLNPAARGL